MRKTYLDRLPFIGVNHVRKVELRNVASFAPGMLCRMVANTFPSLQHLDLSLRGVFCNLCRGCHLVPSFASPVPTILKYEGEDAVFGLKVGYLCFTLALVLNKNGCRVMIFGISHNSSTWKPCRWLFRSKRAAMSFCLTTRGSARCYGVASAMCAITLRRKVKLFARGSPNVSWQTRRSSRSRLNSSWSNGRLARISKGNYPSCVVLGNPSFNCLAGLGVVHSLVLALSLFL